MAIKNYMINDKWLDIAKQNIVEVESTDGVIGSVKVNGQEYGGGGGSSDFSTAEVTVSPNDGYVELNGFVPVILDDEGEFITCVDSLENGYNVVLYNGSLVLVTTTEPTYTVSGNATLETIEPIMPMEPKRYKLTITGDCTITIS